MAHEKIHQLYIPLWDDSPEIISCEFFAQAPGIVIEQYLQGKPGQSLILLESSLTRALLKQN
jgi:hypothetical protein